LAIHPFYSLDQLEDPEVIKMYDKQRETGNDAQRDPPLFHEGAGGEVATVDGARVGVCDFPYDAAESGRAAAFEQSVNVTVGDYADPF
jgi:hypothetical protein